MADRVIEWFDKMLRLHGPTSAGVGMTEVSQKAKFEALNKIGGLDGAEVLDVGCGYGGFRIWLKERGIAPRYYLGVDGSKAMIETAWSGSAQENQNTSFRPLLYKDLPGYLTAREFDYVVASDPLNVRLRGWLANELAMSRLIRDCWDVAREGVVVVASSAQWDGQRNPNIHYYTAAFLTRVASRFTRSWILDHSFLPHEQAIYLWKS